MRFSACACIFLVNLYSLLVLTITHVLPSHLNNNSYLNVFLVIYEKMMNTLQNKNSILHQYYSMCNSQYILLQY